jgi:hypothetical protein
MVGLAFVAERWRGRYIAHRLVRKFAEDSGIASCPSRRRGLGGPPLPEAQRDTGGGQAAGEHAG